MLLAEFVWSTSARLDGHADGHGMSLVVCLQHDSRIPMAKVMAQHVDVGAYEPHEGSP